MILWHRHLFYKAFLHLVLVAVSGRSSAYGDTAVEGHPAGPGSISSSTGAISTTTAQQEGEGSDGEAENEGDIHTSNRSDITKCKDINFIFFLESICLHEGKL